LSGNENTRRIGDTIGENDLLDTVAQDLLHLLAQFLKGLLLFLSLLLLLLCLLKL
jgi:hypothetical protein